MFVPGPVTSSVSCPVAAFARAHQILPVTSAAEVIAEATGRVDLRPSGFAALATPQRWLVEAMEGGMHVDAGRLSQPTGLPLHLGVEALEALAAAGWVERTARGSWRLLRRT